MFLQMIFLWIISWYCQYFRPCSTNE